MSGPLVLSFIILNRVRDEIVQCYNRCRTLRELIAKRALNNHESRLPDAENYEEKSSTASKLSTSNEIFSIVDVNKLKKFSHRHGTEKR